MDILTNPLTLIILAVIFMLMAFTGTLNPVREKQLITFLKATGRLVLDLVKAMAKLGTGILGLFAESAKTTGANEASNNAARGGVLNYRTGKLDEGNNAAGWYEND